MALVDTLKASRERLANIIDAQLAAWEAAGQPPTIGIDGESYDWSSWLKSRLEELDAITAQIRNASSPYLIRSRGRA